MSAEMIYDDAARPYGNEKLGVVQKGGRLVIVAENNNIPGLKMWVEAIPEFNSDQTAVELGFWLYCQRGSEKIKHVTISHGVVESALAQRRKVVASAAVDQYGWLAQNFEEASSIIFASYQLRTVKQAPSSGQINSI